MSLDKFEPSVQVEKLKRELEAQMKEKEALESRTSGAEKKIKELGSTIENVCYLFVSYFFSKSNSFFFPLCWIIL